MLARLASRLGDESLRSGGAVKVLSPCPRASDTLIFD